MDKKLTVLHRVVEAESYGSIVYPRWSDYGCLCDTLRVYFIKDDGTYGCSSFTKEDLEPPYICNEPTEIHWATVEEIAAYHEYLLQKRINENQISCFGAIKGDIIEIIAGRKYPIGTRFILTGKEHIHYDCYHRPVAYYWITTDGKRVLKHNAKIVGHIPYDKETYLTEKDVKNFFGELGLTKLDQVYKDLAAALADSYMNIAYLKDLKVSDRDDSSVEIDVYVKSPYKDNMGRLHIHMHLNYYNNKEE